MNISIISEEVARWAELFLFLAVAVATASSLSSSSVVAADEANVAYLQSTHRQLSNSFASDHRALRRDDEQPSEEEPDVASIINGMPTNGPLSYQVGLAKGAGFLPFCSGSLIAPRVVLTAARCIIAPDGIPFFPPRDKVLINAYNLSVFDQGIPNGGGIVKASSYAVHPDYNTTSKTNNCIMVSTISCGRR